jgi:hypothetical protein
MIVKMSEVLGAIHRPSSFISPFIVTSYSALQSSGFPPSRPRDIASMLHVFNLCSISSAQDPSSRLSIFCPSALVASTLPRLQLPTGRIEAGPRLWGSIDAKKQYDTLCWVSTMLQMWEKAHWSQKPGWSLIRLSGLPPRTDHSDGFAPVSAHISISRNRSRRMLTWVFNL